MSERWHVHFAGGQKIKWALDEDLRWAREALGGAIREVSPASARIVHAAWWPALLVLGCGVLEGKTVLCFADNPPAFYLTQPGFEEVAKRVDLWIARSREAVWQFQSLGLRVAMAPYCVDPQVFRPIPDREAIRRECGLPDEAIVVGNFHRDSEGSDLGKPKAQKGPDIFLEVVKRLHRTNPRVTVLLAGPRRHWLREELKKAGIPYYFAGVVRDGDDYEVNILGRERLNQLYQALDLCLISSRWEGGPYSVLEAVFSGCPVVSTPVGMARDVLPEACIFRTVEEAVTAIETGVSARRAAGRIVNGRESALKKFALPELRKALLEIYQPFPRGGVSLASAARSCGKGIIHQFDARWRKSPDEPQITKATPAEGLLPVETPLDKGPNREFLNQIASDIAWFRN